ncbi:PIN domain protein [Methanobrevibacter cuticularis]|uniref:PIN domain protein n=1 Tax=Methanobrevibacter cuticularis TaxID=47311 RepID=A0A166EML0_9EURY|nr:PIN domain-containing protein [Methanobrevibacter cuticularis]KZX16815.1 PIN domain protein [Methanobrevibacter cuticularis]
MANKLIFIDSNFIVGLTVDNDKWHEKANELIPYINKKVKVTCLSAVFESITLINKKVGVDIAKTVYEYIMDNFIIITEDRSLCDKSIKTLVKYHKLSLADSTIVEIMKEMNIIELISFDDDFDRVNGIIRIHNKKNL